MAKQQHKMIYRILLVMAALVALSPVLSFAQFEEPEGLTFSYHGYLEGFDGEPIDGFIAMEFRLYAEPEFGRPEWEEINPEVEVVGVITVELGRMAYAQILGE